MRCLLVCACLVGCYSETELANEEKVLAKAALGNADLEVVGHLVGRHWSGRLDAGEFGPEWIRAGQSFGVSYTLRTALTVPNVGDWQARRQSFGTELPARGTYDAMTAETCGEGGQVALRVAPHPWEVLRRFGSGVVREMLPEQEGCPQLQPLDEWVQTAMIGCDVISRGGREAEAAQCVLRGGASYTQEMGPGHVAALREALLGGGSFAPARALAAGEALSATDAAAVLQGCTAQACPGWRLAAVVGAVAARGSSADLCGAIAEKSVFDQDGGGVLAMVQRLPDCATDAQLAPVMRRGLTQRTGRDHIPEDRNQFIYGSAVGQCDPKDLTQSGTYARERCDSLPRLAAFWLAGHCDADAVAAANDALVGYAGDWDPRVDMVFDGALRVLAACDEAAFEAAIAGAPDEPPTVAAVELRSKRQLRELYGVVGP